MPKNQMYDIKTEGDKERKGKVLATQLSNIEEEVKIIEIWYLFN